VGSAMVSLGMLGVFPDYAGLSGLDPLEGAPELPSVHSYIQTATYERTTEDVMKAVASLADKPINGDGPVFRANYNVVTTGYSQGGFAALASATGMASGRASLPEGYSLAATAPQAGPYDPAATYDGTDLNGYSIPMYVPYLVLGAVMETGRHDLLGDIFVDEWKDQMPVIYGGMYSNGELGDVLPEMITDVFTEGATEALFAALAVYVDGKIPSERPPMAEEEPPMSPGDSKEALGAWMLWAMVKPNRLADPHNVNTMVNVPTHFCHSDADEQVEYLNSVTTHAAYVAAGNNKTVFLTVDDGSAHSAAALKCIPAGIDFLWTHGADVTAAVGYVEVVEEELPAEEEEEAEEEADDGCVDDTSTAGSEWAPIIAMGGCNMLPTMLSLGLTCDSDLAENAVVQGLAPGVSGGVRQFCGASCGGCVEEEEDSGTDRSAMTLFTGLSQACVADCSYDGTGGPKCKKNQEEYGVACSVNTDCVDFLAGITDGENQNMADSGLTTASEMDQYETYLNYRCGGNGGGDSSDFFFQFYVSCPRDCHSGDSGFDRDGLSKCSKKQTEWGDACKQSHTCVDFIGSLNDADVQAMSNSVGVPVDDVWHLLGMVDQSCIPDDEGLSPATQKLMKMCPRDCTDSKAEVKMLGMNKCTKKQNEWGVACRMDRTCADYLDGMSKKMMKTLAKDNGVSAKEMKFLLGDLEDTCQPFTKKELKEANKAAKKSKGKKNKKSKKSKKSKKNKK